MAGRAGPAADVAAVLAALIAAQGVRAGDLPRQAGCTASHLFHILNRQCRPSPALAPGSIPPWTAVGRSMLRWPVPRPPARGGPGPGRPAAMTDQISTTVPHSARVWNYWLGGKDHCWLGGKDHCVIDARLGQYCASFYPGMPVLARSCRYFTARVISYLAGAGIRQFLDVGCGLPAPAGNTHQIAQAIAPDSHIIYADHDPLVLAYARALLTCGPRAAPATWPPTSTTPPPCSTAPATC